MASRIDLTNQKINEWLVLKYVGKGKYICKCSCGTVKEVNQAYLRNGKSKSCGHLKLQRDNLAGKVFSEWTVLNYAENNMWRCKCSCGVEKTVKAQYLKSGASKSCGHSTTKFKDLKDKEFNEWTVLEYAGNQKWKCRCSCGEVREVETYNLINNRSKSCGHNKNIPLKADKSFKDLKDKKFNEWEVLEYQGDSMWKCRCSCGKIKDVHRYSLTSGKSKSCGHNILTDLTDQRFGKLQAKQYIGNQQWMCICDCGNSTIVYAHNLLKFKGTSSCGCSNNANTIKLNKEFILEKIKSYMDIYKEYPCIKDLEKLINRSETVTRGYIHKYKLENYINFTYKSRYEKEIATLFDNVIISTRSVISPLELDIYIPEKKLAIEFNGSYWHSDIYKDKYYHQNKTIACAKQGIQLIHIFEYEWLDLVKKEKLLTMLNRLSGKAQIQEIYARKTSIKLIEYDIASDFLDKYHLQGKSSSAINLGCFLNNQLIGVLTLGKPRFNSKYEYEIHRLCWHPNFKVIGGAEKLFKYFLKNYNPTSIITYSDISKFTGNVYLKLGFKPIQPNPITEPNYIWVDTYNNKIMPRYKTQKHKLVSSGLGNKNQTEDEIMHNLGFYKLYDSGNIKLEYIK